MADNEHLHIFLPNNAKRDIGFSQSASPNSPHLPTRDRRTHGEYLTNRFNVIWQELEEKKEERSAVSLPTKGGLYLEFKGQAGYDLVTKSLESTRAGVRLLNVRQVETESGKETYATVYVPENKLTYFLGKVREYAEQDTSSGKPKNQPLVNSIEEVVLAAQLQAFWQDAPNLIPQEEPVWCEAWLSFPEDGTEIVEIKNQFFDSCSSIQIEHKNEALHFPERLVVLIKANGEQLKELIERSDLIAEFRKAQETASYWTRQENIEQLEWVEDLLQRLNFTDSGVAVTILDGGVNNGHLLLQPVLADNDCLTYNPDWGGGDNGTHGTLMSGVAAYGNLLEKLEHSLPVEVVHKLESVKILPPVRYNENPFELWGEITSQAISYAEIENPDRLRVICLAVTSKRGTDFGRPSSWSASIDTLTSGAEDGVQRLLIISAGNMYEGWNLYPDSNLKSSIQSPAQSWNAITVGAFTNKIQINEEDYRGYRCLAPAGCLSPFSSTSCSWETKKWPIKPDIVMEGGNLLVAPDGLLSEHDDLSLLTTSSQSTHQQFDWINMTSAATAMASWFAAQLQGRYPNAWPETIRGLMVHSAEWTEGMIAQFNINLNRKGDVAKLLRTCGYGVPNLRKALNSINNSLTIVAQETIQPFCRRDSGSGYKAKDMHLYELPWPVEQLQALGEQTVQVKITLSYFIEPGPGEIGWKDRYRYASHGLRFDMNTPTESREEFVSRINIAAREENETPTGNSGSDRWLVGSNTRHHGSIHSDTIEGTASDIAACRYIGIYPVVGWWRERTNLKMMEKSTRYSLIISLKTEEQEVDLYTPIVNMIEITTTTTTIAI